MFACLPLVHIFQVCLYHFHRCSIKSTPITWIRYSMCSPVMTHKISFTTKNSLHLGHLNGRRPTAFFFPASHLFLRNCITSITRSPAPVSPSLIAAPSCKNSKSVMLSFNSVNFPNAHISDSPTVFERCCTR